MTTDEMFQLLIDKFTKLENKVDANHKEVTGKIDAVAADVSQIKADVDEIKADVQYLKNNDDTDTLSINNIYNEIKDIKETVNAFDKQVQAVDYLDNSVAHFHTRLNHVEKEVTALKHKLDKAS